MTFDNELSARSKLNEGGRIDVSAHSYKASILDNSSVFLTMWEDVGSIGENGVGTSYVEVFRFPLPEVRRYRPSVFES